MEEAIKLLQPEQVKREAEQLAGKIYGKIPIFYSSQNLAAVAYRMKTQINENAKQPAFCHIFPEMNHNEINGFKNMGKRMVMVFIRDENDPPQIKRRMDITKTLIENETNAAEISVRGKSLLARILTTVYVGDMASYYLATMNNEDPTPVPIITELKARLEG
jgi:glucose/mannose-6-phosphate isomerase